MRYILWVVALLVLLKKKTTEILKKIDARLVEYDIIKHFATFCLHFELLKNTHFYSKMAQPPATYGVVSNDSNQTCVKMCLNVFSY